MKSKYKEVVARWVEEQDEDRWLTATYKEICDELKADNPKIAVTTVRLNLLAVMSEKLGIPQSEVAEKKVEYRDSINNLTSAKLRLAMDYYNQDVSILDIAQRLGFSYNFMRGAILKELKAREHKDTPE